MKRAAGKLGIVVGFVCPALVGALAVGGLVGCDSDNHDRFGSYRDEGSDIVFGIAQSKDATGAVSTSVGYEYLDILNQGWSTVGLVNRSESCWAERLDDRAGQPHVEGGVATFTGGVLPANGIAVIANHPDDLVLPAASWTMGGVPLTFASQGFAMPSIDPATIYTPSPDLTVTTPSDPSANVAIAGSAGTANSQTPTTFAWTPSTATDGPHESVVVSINAIPASTPNAQGVELRCFFDQSAGQGSLPQELVQRFIALVDADPTTGASPTTTPTTPITGTFHMATHRQLTIFADGGWTVYVTAMVNQREQPFTLQR